MEILASSCSVCNTDLSEIGMCRHTNINFTYTCKQKFTTLKLVGTQSQTYVLYMRAACLV